MSKCHVYFTETHSGNILCESEDDAKSVIHDLEENGLPLDELDRVVKYVSGDREFKHELHH